MIDMYNWFVNYYFITALKTYNMIINNNTYYYYVLH